MLRPLPQDNWRQLTVGVRRPGHDGGKHVWHFPAGPGHPEKVQPAQGHGGRGGCERSGNGGMIGRLMTMFKGD